MTEFHAYYELRAVIRNRVAGTSALDAARNVPTARELLQRAAADHARTTTALEHPELILLAVVTDFEAAEHTPTALAEQPRRRPPEAPRARLRRLRAKAEAAKRSKRERHPVTGMQYLWSARMNVCARFGLIIEAPTRTLAQARAEEARLAVLTALPGCLQGLHTPQAVAGPALIELWTPAAARAEGRPAPEIPMLPPLATDRPQNRPPGHRRYLVEHHTDLHCLRVMQAIDGDDARERTLAYLIAQGYPDDGDVHGATMTVDCVEEEAERRVTAPGEPQPLATPDRVFAGVADDWSAIGNDEDEREIHAFHAALANATVADITGEHDAVALHDEDPTPTDLPIPSKDAPQFEVAFLTTVSFSGYVWARDESHADEIALEDLEARAEADSLDQCDLDVDGVEFSVVHVEPHSAGGTRP